MHPARSDPGAHCSVTTAAPAGTLRGCIESLKKESRISPPAHHPHRVSVSFVCDVGHLEAQAVLLGASLRAQHADLSLIAAVPRQPGETTRRALDALGVTRADIVNPVASDYPIGHKVAALGAGEAGGLRVFLDTDTLCLRALDWSALRTSPFAAKPADVATFGDMATWQRLYARFDLPVPTQRVAASVSHGLMLPYFNAGMLATARAQDLAAEWARICRAIDAMEDINPRRPWLDQIALPIAVARLGLAFRSLGEAWNYPVHLKPLSGGPAIVHYHQPDKVAREPALVARVARLLTLYACIGPVLEADPLWAPVLDGVRRHSATRAPRHWPWRRARHARSASGPSAPMRQNHDLIISGIPRSGTSYLCRCLDSFDNVAVINEPQALFHGLPLCAEPWAVPMLHADLRRRIEAGEAVDNKTDARGALTEDTAVEESITAYRPQLRDARWLLASKNTLAYMARLEGLLRLMPEARVVDVSAIRWIRWHRGRARSRIWPRAIPRTYRWAAWRTRFFRRICVTASRVWPHGPMPHSGARPGGGFWRRNWCGQGTHRGGALRGSGRGSGRPGAAGAGSAGRRRRQTTGAHAPLRRQNRAPADAGRRRS